MGRSKNVFAASLPLRQREGLGLGLEASTAHIPCAALQGYLLTPTRLPKEHPCLLHPSGLAIAVHSSSLR